MRQPPVGTLAVADMSDLVTVLTERIDEMLERTRECSLFAASEIGDFCLDLRNLVTKLETRVH